MTAYKYTFSTKKIQILDTFFLRILKALNPWEALYYLIIGKKRGFFQIGSVLLAVTGLEALYIELGHFGR
jgi:K+ transporter